MRLVGMLIFVLGLTACAADIHVPYPYPEAQNPTGRVLIKFTEPVRHVHVQVDGALIVEEEYTERVTIEDVPVGSHQVEVAASEASKSEAVHVQREVEVEEGRTTTILIGTPPVNSGFWTYMAAFAAMYWWVVFAR